MVLWSVTWTNIMGAGQWGGDTTGTHRPDLPTGPATRHACIGKDNFRQFHRTPNLFSAQTSHKINKNQPALLVGVGVLRQTGQAGLEL